MGSLKLYNCIYEFLLRYLPKIRGVSHHTIDNYRGTFALFLPFCAQYFSVNLNSLRVEHLSPSVVLAFLDYLEAQRKNVAKTRNTRLGAIKSLSKMIRLIHPEKTEIAEKILRIPKKKEQKTLMGFLYPDEILSVLASVDLKRNEGFRDYTILHLLFDSGARASEVAELKLDYFDPAHRMMAILGKGNRFRLVTLNPKTTQLLRLYIVKYRSLPKPIFSQRIFINQRGEGLTRYGINRLCRRYLSLALPQSRVKTLNPVHSFRHSRAVNMLASGCGVEEIANRLGHQNTNSALAYFHLDLPNVQAIQRQLNEDLQSMVLEDQKVEELIDWRNKRKVLSWLDSL
jgi:integrase/recombinase XerD